MFFVIFLSKLFVQAELTIVNKVCLEKSPKASESTGIILFYFILLTFKFVNFILKFSLNFKEIEATYYGLINSSGYPNFIKLSVS